VAPQLTHCERKKEAETTIEIADDDDEPSREDEHPVSGSVKPGTSGVPKSPNKNPPRNSPTLGASPENTMTKSESGVNAVLR